MRSPGKRARKEIDFALFVVPAFMFILTFMGLPLIMSFAYAFTEWRGISQNVEFIGFGHFIKIFSTSEWNFWNASLFTLRFTLVNVVLVNLISLGLALLLTYRIPAKGLFRASFFLPYVLSTVIVSFIWRFIFKEGSLALYAYTGLGFLKASWLSDPGIVFYSFVFVELWKSVGFYMVIFIAGLESIPEELYEASKMDGAGVWWNLKRITIPMLAPAATTAMFFSLVSSLKVFDLVYGLTQGGPGRITESVAFNIYKTGFIERNYGLATAKGLVLFIFILAATVLQLKYSKSKEIDL